MQSFTIEIGMNSEDTFYSGNFQLCLKHFKFKMHSYNLILKKNGNYL